MGAWGTALYSDDLACDVQESFRALIGDGLDAAAATRELLSEFSELDAGELSVFWIALAHTQWKLGRQTEEVKHNAITAIESGADLDRWEKPADRRKRAAVLQKVLEEIRSVPPAPKPVKPAFRDDCQWAVGEVIGYELKSGTKVVFQVCGHHTDDGGRSPIVELLQWVGTPADSFPALAELQHLQPYPADSVFMIGRTSQRAYPEQRLFRLKVSLPLANTKIQLLPISLWQRLDEDLAQRYGIH